MAAQEPQDPTQEKDSNTTEVQPPLAQNTPEPNMPDPSLLASANQTPPPSQAPANLGSGAVTTQAGKKRGVPKKLIFGLLGLLLVGGLLAAVVTIVLPNLGSGFGGGNTELRWWGLWEDDSIITPIIEEYQAQNPGVTIVYERQDKENYRERLVNSMAREEAPDIFRMHNTWTPMFARQLSTLPASIMSTEEYQSTFYPVAYEDFATQQGVTAIPLMYDGLGLFINEEIFSTYGAQIPESWSDLRDTAISLTIKDDRDVIQQAGVALGVTENVDHWQEILSLMLIQNKADLVNADDEETEQAMLFFRQFTDTDEVWDETQPTSTIAFAAGKVAMYFGPSWRAFEIIEQNPSLRFKVVSVPQLQSTDPNATSLTYATYWGEAVWSGSENEEEAWKFLKYLSSQENLQKLYQNASNLRKFGEPYSRQDMRSLLLSDPIVGGFVELAPSAKSWYLASRTFDGDSGINTALSQYYEDTLNTQSASRGSINTTNLSLGLKQVLSRYGLVAPPPPPEE